MTYKKDDKVFVKSLKKEGVIVEVLKTGDYAVSFGSLRMTCSEKDLGDINDKQWKKYVKSAKPATYSAPKLTVSEAARTSIDLHGLTVEQAMPMVMRMIDRAIIADMDKVEIVHGIGEGKLLSAIHKFLKQQSVVKNFRLDENNPGVTWVYF